MVTCRRSESGAFSRRGVLASMVALGAVAAAGAASAQQPDARPKGPRVWLDLDQKELDEAYDRAPELNGQENVWQFMRHCQIASSNPSTTSSIIAATPGTRSSISRGRSCPSPAAIGPSSVTQSEDWYKTSWAAAGPRRVRCLAYRDQTAWLGVGLEPANPSAASSARRARKRNRPPTQRDFQPRRLNTQRRWRLRFPAGCSSPPSFKVVHTSK